MSLNIEIPLMEKLNIVNKYNLDVNMHELVNKSEIIEYTKIHLDLLTSHISILEFLLNKTWILNLMKLPQVISEIYINKYFKFVKSSLAIQTKLFKYYFQFFNKKTKSFDDSVTIPLPVVQYVAHMAYLIFLNSKSLALINNPRSLLDITFKSIVNRLVHRNITYDRYCMLSCVPLSLRKEICVSSIINRSYISKLNDYSFNNPSHYSELVKTFNEIVKTNFIFSSELIFKLSDLSDKIFTI